MANVDLIQFANCGRTIGNLYAPQASFNPSKVLAHAKPRTVSGAQAHLPMFMNNVFNPSANAGCAKIPSSRAV
jgi:hypothetical protein